MHAALEIVGNDKTRTRRKTAAKPHPGGRLQIGIPAAFTSENLAGINRNPHT